MLELEYWWLLALPLFFALGWLAARIDIDQLLSETSTLPAAYFKGLNFLISDQHDKAIEAFTEAVEDNSESLEIHFALGSLFRRRGEVDRAIRLHQKLLEHKDMPEPQREAVLAELAQDHLKAGLLDRAEELFRKLTESRYQQPALQALLEIYIQEKEWARAIEMALELERLSGHSFRTAISHFHCELATNARFASDINTARRELAAALAVRQNCVRANLMLGEIEAEAGDHEAAIAAWKRIELQRPEYLGLSAPLLLASYRKLGKTAEGLALLKSYLQKYNLPSILNVVFDAALEEENPVAAAQLAREELAHKPSMHILDRLLQAQALSGDASQRKDNQLMHDTVNLFLGKTSSHCCTVCGFRARKYHYHCPGCGGWETFTVEPAEPSAT
jgi:lipopolysaccharide biosynthesis regulator YciM